MNEQEFVAKEFQNAFAGWRNDPFVLYGLGKNTEAVLKRTEGFQFVGLMDGGNTGREFWGLRVLSEKEVLAHKPRIVIIARESVVPVIYERIAHLQTDHGLQIYNFRGKLLGGQGIWKYTNQNLAYWNVTEVDLKTAIDRHECISFDIFDTLLMRRVLEVEDVFRIVERLLEEKGYVENRFWERRVEAEKSLSGYPNLGQIYEEMGRQCHLSFKVLADWMETEIAVEEQVIVPRRRMKAIFEYALVQGKRVFLISDMYFTGKELEKFLKRHGIGGYERLLVSCEYGKAKADGKLYDVYRNLAAGTSWLHIGDNRRSDGESAVQQGLDTFLIYSAYEMWMASSMQTTLSHINSLEQRCILGNLVWRCCEDPFSMHEGRGLFTVDTPEKLGYFFLGALYDEFIPWLCRAVEEEGAEQLLLPARDGFLIKELLEQEETLLFDPVYFKASRRAVSVAAIQSTEDILLLARRSFQGTYGELLLSRFGVKPRVEDSRGELSVKGAPLQSIQEYILSYQDEILRHAEAERRGYLDYLDTMKLRNGKTQAMFDFVAGGTMQYYMRRILDKELKGFYFATMNHPDERYHLEGEIVSAYGNICSYGAGNCVAKHYLFLETIMVDGCPTLKCIENGTFHYEPEVCNSFPAVRKVQEGILRYRQDMREMRKLVPRWGDEREFADKLLGKLFSGECQVPQAIRQAFVNEDVFDGVATYQVWSDSGTGNGQ